VTTPLEGPLKRAVVVDGEPYTLTITPDGLTLVPKGHRKGHALAWRDLVSGEAALATALNASLHAVPGRARPAPPAAPVSPRTAAKKGAPPAPAAPRKRGAKGR
jgi:hypothetical protein